MDQCAEPGTNISLIQDVGARSNQGDIDIEEYFDMEKYLELESASKSDSGSSLPSVVGTLIFNFVSPYRSDVHQIGVQSGAY